MIPKIQRFSFIQPDRSFYIKVRREIVARIIIVTWWVTQFSFQCWCLFFKISQQYFLQKLTLPSNKGLQHTLYPKMKLLEVPLSGKSSDTQNFHQKLPTKVILESWQTSTRFRQESVLKRWNSYAISSNEDPYPADANNVLTFMHGMFLRLLIQWVTNFFYKNQ